MAPWNCSKKIDRQKKALQRLLQCVRPLNSYLARGLAIPRLGFQPGNTYLSALVALASRRRSWIRRVETWQPRERGTRQDFASLARHLLARYEVPSFMDSVWFRGVGEESHRRQSWFIHLAQGRCICQASIPLPYTRRMAFYFAKAPHNYSVEAALRWGQIHGLGGDARLSEAIRDTRLGSTFEHNEFCTSVLRFFIANPTLDGARIGQIIEYLHYQRFQWEEVFIAPGVAERRPPRQPNLCMRGRTVQSLLSQVQRWHRHLIGRTLDYAQWPATGIAPFDLVEGSHAAHNLKHWTIRELLSSPALEAEGSAMHHCVCSYAGACARRITSIWTLQVEDEAGPQRVLTIEVLPKEKLISQARGKSNTEADEKAKGLLRRWASHAGLTLASYL